MRRLSGAAHQTCPRTVADFSYRATSGDLSINVWEVILIMTTQSTRIRYINLIRRFAALDNPNTARLTDPQYRHQALRNYIRPAKTRLNSNEPLKNYLC